MSLISKLLAFSGVMTLGCVIGAHRVFGPRSQSAPPSTTVTDSRVSAAAAEVLQQPSTTGSAQRDVDFELGLDYYCNSLAALMNDPEEATLAQQRSNVWAVLLLMARQADQVAAQRGIQVSNQTEEILKLSQHLHSGPAAAA